MNPSPKLIHAGALAVTLRALGRDPGSAEAEERPLEASRSGWPLVARLVEMVGECALAVDGVRVRVRPSTLLKAGAAWSVPSDVALGLVRAAYFDDPEASDLPPAFAFAEWLVRGWIREVLGLEPGVHLGRLELDSETRRSVVRGMSRLLAGLRLSRQADRLEQESHGWLSPSDALAAVLDFDDS